MTSFYIYLKISAFLATVGLTIIALFVIGAFIMFRILGSLHNEDD